ncbi:hypothetical protein SCOR_27545 [Sulfidibacter corallicola]
MTDQLNNFRFDRMETGTAPIREPVRVNDPIAQYEERLRSWREELSQTLQTHHARSVDHLRALDRRMRECSRGHEDSLEPDR